MKPEIVALNAKRFGYVLFLALAGLYLCVATPHVFAAPLSAPCSENSESWQLDYWLGTWAVTTPGGTNASTSKVSLALDGCVVVERWNDGRGHRGENIFAYTYDDKSWRGMFVDNKGRAHAFVDGKVASDSAEFYGPSRGPDGKKVLNRVRIVRVAPNQVEQTWAKSTDNGMTWTTVFRGEYSRKNP